MFVKLVRSLALSSLALLSLSACVTNTAASDFCGIFANKYPLVVLPEHTDAEAADVISLNITYEELCIE
jgi:hypothetical protein